jgi:endonuclease/exonuclease/phosphatase family metal-dependent hydrolase
MASFRTAFVGAFVVVAVSCTSGGDDDVAEPADTTGGDADVTVVSYNVFTGALVASCSEQTGFCQAETRLEMIWDLVEDAGCPDVLALQELGPPQRALIPPRLSEVCDGRYALVSEPPVYPVESWVLSSLPVIDAATEPISGASRAIEWVRLESELGPIDLYTTHFVAGVDDLPCTPEFCAPGISAGVCTLEMDAGMCNPREALDFVDRTAGSGNVTILTGDLNAEITEDRIVTLTDAGFVDVWTLAGNRECDPDTAENCTSGQSGDEEPDEVLGIPKNVRDNRIDFVLVRSPADCDLTVDEPVDGDGDGTSTGIFAGQPFDPPVEGLFWPSDHAGVQADIACI